MAERVDLVVQTFYDIDKTFINDKVLKNHKNILNHIRNGCVSDPQSIPMYMERNDGSVICARGTNGLESWHSFADSLAATAASPSLCDMALNILTFRWNYNHMSYFDNIKKPKSFNVGLMKRIWDLKQSQSNFKEKIDDILDFSKFNFQIPIAPFGCRYDISMESNIISENEEVEEDDEIPENYFDLSNEDETTIRNLLDIGSNTIVYSNDPVSPVSDINIFEYPKNVQYIPSLFVNHLGSNN